MIPAGPLPKGETPGFAASDFRAPSADVSDDALIDRAYTFMLRLHLLEEAQQGLACFSPKAFGRPVRC